FFALKTPAPTSTPTSCPNTVAPVARLKQSAAAIKTTARRIALVLIILSLVLFGLRKMQLMDPCRTTGLDCRSSSALGANTIYMTAKTDFVIATSWTAHQPETQ